MIGQLAHTDSVVYGPALVDAHRLERELAVYPRIVVREADLKDMNFSRDELAQQILRMDDGVPFLNPITNWLPPVPEAIPRARSQFIREHEKWSSCLRALKAAGPPSGPKAKVIAKHEWFLSYLRKAGAMVGATFATDDDT